MTLAQEINRMIRTALESLEITSAGGASPNINTVIQVNQEDNPDLEALIREGSLDTESAKQRFTSSQFGNLKEFVSNPAQFMIQTVFRKFAKGAGIFALALIIFEAVKWIISELLKPGRFLDLRFKRDINQEIIAFRQREDQQRLKQGFSNIIITTTPRLRGGQGQFVNTLDLAAGRGKFPDNIGQSGILLEAAGVSLSKCKGAGRRGSGRLG